MYEINTMKPLKDRWKKNITLNDNLQQKQWQSNQAKETSNKSTMDKRCFFKMQQGGMYISNLI